MNELELKRKEIVKYCLSQNVLVKPEQLAALTQPEKITNVYEAIKAKVPAQQLVKGITKKNTQKFALPVKIIWQYDDKPRKRVMNDFVDYFNARYKALEAILRQHQELANATSIGRLQNKKDSESVSIIGIVSEKQTTKKENIILTLEDRTGTIKAIITKNKQELYEQAKDIVCDEVIGIKGASGNNVIFADTIVHPDIPVTGEIKKSPYEAYVAILSCIHVGSKKFMREAFERFINWLNAKTGNTKEDELARKVGCVIIAGDVVDGVGVYPQQEQELAIPDIYEQYAEFARLISKTPQHIPLVILPGNHDAGRISEPQPPLSKKYAQPVHDLPNTILPSNPCMINLGATQNFPGFDILIYHGFSFDDYGEIVPSIKNSGKNISERAPLIMRFLLQRRHLAPQHATTLYIPDPEKDPLVIEKVPDIFVAGHIHKSNTATYRGTTLVCASCFQEKTLFQEKVGHEPDPGVVPLINLQTRQVIFKNFA